MGKKTALTAGEALMVALSWGVNSARNMGAIASGYVAQSLCTSVVVPGRDEAIQPAAQRQGYFNKASCVIRRRT